MPVTRNQISHGIQVYRHIIAIPEDYVEVYHQLEYIRKQRKLRPQDVHACAVDPNKDEAGWACAICDTPASRVSWSLQAAKRHDEGHGHVERVAAKYNVDLANFGRKIFCALCRTWIVDRRFPNKAEDHHRNVHGSKAREPTPEEISAVLLAWWKSRVPANQTRPRHGRANQTVGEPQHVSLPWAEGEVYPSIAFQDIDTMCLEDYYKSLELARLEGKPWHLSDDFLQATAFDRSRTPLGKLKP